MAELPDFVSENMNKLTIHCSHCNSTMLTPKTAHYYQNTKSIPTIGQKKDASNPDLEEISDWWLVKQMFTFENIGFTHTVGAVKYLSCADCEMGPVGYHDLGTQESFVAISRIKQL